MVYIILAILFITIQTFLLTRLIKVSDNVKYKIIALLVFFQLFLPAALRHSDVYNDTSMYIHHFEKINPKKVFSIDYKSRFEVGYQVLENFIFLKISKSPIALMIITSLLIQASHIIFFYRYSKELWFSVFLYLGFTYYFFTVSGIRQSIAISIFNFSFIFLINKKWIFYVISIICAAQFHSSAYLLLCLPIFYKIRISKKLLITYTVFVLFCFVFLKDILYWYYTYFPKYGDHYLAEQWISKSKIGTYFIIFTNVLGLVIVLKNNNFKDYSFEEKYMLFSYFMVITFLIFSLKISVFSRVTYYFVPATIVILANSCWKIKNNFYRNIMYSFWVVFLLCEIMVILLYRPNWFNIVPYKFYWQ